MAHKLEKRWKNEIFGKKNIELQDKNPWFWKPFLKMKGLFFSEKHKMKEDRKNFPPVQQKK